MNGNQSSVQPQEDRAYSSTERVVAHVWHEVLRIPQMPLADDNFFALGGDSMTMVLAEFRVAEEFGLQLPAGAMLCAPTVRELAALIDAEMHTSSPPGTSESDGPFPI